MSKRDETTFRDPLLSLGLTATGASAGGSRRQASEGAPAGAALRRPGTPARTHDWVPARPGDVAGGGQGVPVPVWNGLPPYVRWK
jgi:hypothetical protein